MDLNEVTERRRFDLQRGNDGSSIVKFLPKWPIFSMCLGTGADVRLCTNFEVVIWSIERLGDQFILRSFSSELLLLGSLNEGAKFEIIGVDFLRFFVWCEDFCVFARFRGLFDKVRFLWFLYFRAVLWWKGIFFRFRG